ncbi:MAG: MBL fold metallo-hydrolase [Chloroflexi bacterium]|nr:MBL fold metallo-hydrolase [Chloroflexota bacterium]MCI0789072.1 MBL fold metallo-hydrolase [Chloroflexota bacterium]MCI0863408.1 MBL fold metallo-hydrolase [Chloroflexota bacterium]
MKQGPMLETEIIKEGDDSGNGTLVKYTSPTGAVIKAIGVPQSWETTLGPTWCYVIEGDDLTLVDPGCYGSLSFLEEGLEQLGYPLTAVDRIVVTHGHMDHDGSCPPVVRKSGAELWAHEIYGFMLQAGRGDMERGWRREVQGFEAFEKSETMTRVKEHHEIKRGLTLSHPVTDELQAGELTFYHTPGHSPDELCIAFDQVMFSGDHILPLITPHPSVAMSYDSHKSTLPSAYQGANEIYGLKALITSLKRMALLEGDITVLPAHRAFHRGQFNPIGLERATEIVEHHRDRCHQLTEVMKTGPMDLVSLTRKYFSNRELEESNFFLAFTEVMAHIELMQEAGDVSTIVDPASDRMWSNGLGPDVLVRWDGSDRFSAFIDGL